MTEDQKIWYDKGVEDTKRILAHYINEYPHGMSKQEVLNELFDYQTLGDTLAEVYCHITGGMISKPFTNASSIIGEYQRELDESYNQGYQDGKNGVDDDEDDL
jgi:hypothetical protein